MFNLLSSRIRRRFLYPFLSVILALGIILGTPLSGQAIPWLDLIFRGIQIIQLSNVSDRQEVQLGQRINQQLVSREVRLYRDRRINNYVKQIGDRLASESDRPDIPYTFQVVDDPKINAFATMGGFVYVNSGLVGAADNEAQLASVLGHEIGHIAAHHALEQIRQTAIAQGLASAAGLDQNTAVQIGVDLALRRPLSRQDELEADQKGLVTLGRAGYAQSAMVEFMKKLLKASSAPTFLSTHPAVQDRVAALEKAIDPVRGNRGDGLDEVAYRERVRSISRSRS